MKCNKFFGHKWTRWYKKLGEPHKDSAKRIVRTCCLARRCIHCGYIEESWMNSCQVLEDMPEVKPEAKGE